MKITLLIAAGTIAGSLLIQYLMKTKKAGKAITDALPVKNHHLTDVFAHAKNGITRSDWEG